MNRYYTPRSDRKRILSASVHEIHAMAALYALLVVHLSLSPYTGWRYLGASAFDYLSTPWIPPYQMVLWADIVMNVVGYIPLGLLLAMGLYPRVRGWLAIGLTVCVAGGGAACLEALQTFLPARVPSKMDLATNTLGALLGACVAAPVSRWLLETGRWQSVRSQWLEARSTLGLASMLVWLFSLLAPQPVPFAVGPWLGDIWLMLLEQPDWSGSHDALIDTLIDTLIHLETTATSLATLLSLLGAWSLALAQTRPYSPRFRLLLLLMAASLVCGWLGPQVMPLLQGEAFRDTAYLELESRLAISIAVLLGFLLALSAWSSQRLARLALVCIGVAWLCTAALPGYSAAVYWPGGDPVAKVWAHIVEAGSWVGSLWPGLAMYVAWQFSGFFSNSRQN